MGKVFEAISSDVSAWIEKQHIFFVATAPKALNGHINCSPKGLDTFRILGPRTVAYLDLTGSGVETIAHLQENGRIVVMFCAFQGSPKIVRLHGQGKVVYPQDADFPALAANFFPNVGTRAIIVVNVTRISDSCGYAVPYMKFEKEREALDRWAEHKGPGGLTDYRQRKNTASLDGLPGVGPRR